MDWSTYIFMQKPAYQALLFVLLTPIVILILKPNNADRAWGIAAYLFAIYLLIKSVLSWFDISPWRYFFYSIGSSIGYLLCIVIIMQGVIKALRLKASQESSMAFLIIIYQPFILLALIFVRWILTN